MYSTSLDFRCDEVLSACDKKSDFISFCLFYCWRFSSPQESLGAPSLAPVGSSSRPSPGPPVGPWPQPWALSTKKRASRPSGSRALFRLAQGPALLAAESLVMPIINLFCPRHMCHSSQPSNPNVAEESLGLPWGKETHPHFTDEETGAQKSYHSRIQHVERTERQKRWTNPCPC